MRSRRAWLAGLLMVCAQSAAGDQGSAPVLLEVWLDKPTLQDAELLGWDLYIDGAPRPSANGELLRRTAMVRPGPHSLTVQVRYRRELKTVVDPESEAPVSLTFATGVWSLRGASAVEVKAGAPVRVAAVVDEDPDAVDDHLVLLQWAQPPPPPTAEDEARRVVDNFVRLFGGRR